MDYGSDPTRRTNVLRLDLLVQVVWMSGPDPGREIGMMEQTDSQVLRSARRQDCRIQLGLSFEPTLLTGVHREQTISTAARPPRCAREIFSCAHRGPSSLSLTQEQL